MSAAQPAKGHTSTVWLLEPTLETNTGMRGGGILVQGFKLYRMQQQTPEQRLLKLLTQRQWEEALAFANQQQLSTDHIYRSKLAQTFMSA